VATHTGGPAANLHDLGVSLALAWCESYDATTPWAAEIAEIPLGQLTYLFDLAPSQGAVGADDADDRVVGVWGNTTPAERAREASRQRGFLPDPAKWSHVGYDRGHFIAHSLGGGMDLNFFPQASDLNRGNSGRGRRWRRLERLAATRRDAFVFVRPVYTGNTWTPRCLDFGVVSDGTLEFESFDNRPIQT
jgi:hypothetical protein